MYGLLLKCYHLRALCSISVFRMVQQQVVQGGQDVWPVTGKYTVLHHYRLRGRHMGKDIGACG